MSSDPHKPTAGGNYRWVICGLLFFATTVNYVDRQILSLVKEVLDQKLHWSNAEFGAVNSVFQLAYAVSLLFFGWFVDRFGTKLGYALSIGAWSLAAIGHSLVGSVGGFFTARVALGLGEGGNFPSAIKSVALWFPKRERAFATSIFNSGANVGAIVAPAVVPWILLRWGWQASFIAAGVAGFIWLLLWIPFYEIPERSRRLKKSELEFIESDREAPDDPATRPTWRSLLRYRETWAFIVAKFMTDPIWWFFLIWLPDFFQKTRGMNIQKSWIDLVTIYSIITVLSIIGGWITGYLTSRGWTVTRARKTGMLLFAVCVLPILAVTWSGNWVAVLLIGIAGAAHQAWSANLFTTVSDIFPKPAVATLIGVGGTAGAIGGVAFPVICGWVLDRFSASGNVTTGYAILFGICGSAYLIAFAIHHILAPKFEPIALDGR